MYIFPISRSSSRLLSVLEFLVKPPKVCTIHHSRYGSPSSIPYLPSADPVKLPEPNHSRNCHVSFLLQQPWAVRVCGGGGATYYIKGEIYKIHARHQLSRPSNTYLHTYYYPTSTGYLFNLWYVHHAHPRATNRQIPSSEPTEVSSQRRSPPARLGVPGSVPQIYSPTPALRATQPVPRDTLCES